MGVLQPHSTHLPTMYKLRVDSQRKSPYISYFHKMLTRTNPWEPADIYLGIAAHGCGGQECLRYLRSLHAPLVPEATPDHRDDPVGFEKVMKLAKLQEATHTVSRTNPCWTATGGATATIRAYAPDTSGTCKGPSPGLPRR